MHKKDTTLRTKALKSEDYNCKPNSQKKIDLQEITFCKR